MQRPQASRPGKLRRRGSRVLRYGALILAPITLLFGMAAGIAYFRLSQAPVSLEFLSVPIARGITGELTGMRSEIEDVIVVLKPDGGLDFRLKNMRLVDDDGTEIAAAPLAAVALSARALWSGRLVPASVDLIEPEVALKYSERSGLVLNLSQKAQPAAEAKDTSALSRSDREVVPAPTLAARPGTVSTTKTFDLQRVNLAKILSDATARARRGEGATSYLREFGLRDAIVTLDNEGTRSTWHVPRAAIDLDHRSDRSIISGTVQITSPIGPWSLSFLTEASEQTQSVSVKLAVRDLHPRSLITALPKVGVLKTLDLRVGGDATLDLSSSGELNSAQLALQVGGGVIRFPNPRKKKEFPIDAALFSLSYDADQRLVTLAPSTVRWDKSNITLAGTIKQGSSAGKDARAPWSYEVQASEGTLDGEEFGLSPVVIDKWHAHGTISPDTGKIGITAFEIAAGGGQANFSGEVDTMTQEPGLKLEGVLSPMPVSALKAMWPRWVAPGGRVWTGKHISDGKVTGGTIKFADGDYFQGSRTGQSYLDENILVTIETADIVAVPMLGKPAVAAPHVLIHLKDKHLEVSVPDAEILAAPGHGIPIKSGRLSAEDIEDDRPNGKIHFRTVGPVGPVLKLFDHPSLAFKGMDDLPTDRIEGRVEGTFDIVLPLIDDIDRSDVQLAGLIALKDGKVSQLVGKHDAQGAEIKFNVTTKAIDASGQMLLGGVLTKLNWQRIFDAPDDRQPPLRLTANLDAADRAHLGMQADGTVRGDVPLDVTVAGWSTGSPLIHVRADLTQADIAMPGIGWRKTPGRQAFLECDVEKTEKYATYLKDLQVKGDNIAVSGWAGLDGDGKFRAFSFPEFSPDFVTRLKVEGERTPNGLWKVTARGPTYDGRSFFSSLFSLGPSGEAGASGEKPGKNEGINLSAKIETVIGHSDVSLRNLDLKLSKRAGNISDLKARGTLDGGQPLAAEFRVRKDGIRQLLADSTDAGQAFKLIGFYPKVKGGRVRLEVNLDGRGAAQKTGVLWVEKFSVLGDPVVTELVGGVGNPKSANKTHRSGKQDVVHQVFDFDRMRVPFSVGYDQFVLEDSYVRGPVLGATMRGKIDFKGKWVNIGGTYIPLQGLNNILAEVPIVGAIVSGPRGDGIFGVTFAVQGAMDRPQVLVNPLSIVAPGIFREIFQLAPNDPRVRARGKKSRSAPSAAPKVRASSAPAQSRGGNIPPLPTQGRSAP